MVAVKLATVAALLQLASAGVVSRAEPKHYPTFGLKVVAEGTPYHNKFVTLQTAPRSTRVKLGLIPEGDSGHSIDAEFFIREDGHLSYGQPGSSTGTYVLAFDPEEGQISGAADAYFIPSNKKTVDLGQGIVRASAGGKEVVALDGLELKVKGEPSWLVCPTRGGKDKSGKWITIHNLAYDNTVNNPDWVGRDSAADHCTSVVVKKVDLE